LGPDGQQMDWEWYEDTSCELLDCIDEHGRCFNITLGGLWDRGDWPFTSTKHLDLDSHIDESTVIHNIVKNAAWSYYLATAVKGQRVLEAEPVIAISNFKNGYLYHFPQAKDDWLMNGLLDWLDT
jgi:hypothetical protein